MGLKGTRLARLSAPGSSRLVTLVLEGVDALIARGDLVQGQRLIEADLMQRFGVGRMPVREALRILAGDGVVELNLNRSVRIRLLTPGRLAQMQQVFDPLFQTAMELFLSAGRTPDGIAALREARDHISDMRRKGSAQEILDAIISFHLVTVAHSGNDFLVELFARMHLPFFRRGWAEAIEHNGLMDVSSIYDELTDLLIEGDLHSTVARMKPYLIRFEKLLRKRDQLTS